MQIVITPQFFIPLEKQQAASQPQGYQLFQLEVPMVWVQEGANFRLDITFPEPCALNILFPRHIESLHINGHTIWGKAKKVSIADSGMRARMSASGLQLDCAASGALHILARFSIESETTRSAGGNETN